MVKSCTMKSYNGRPFLKKAYQIQILLAIWPNKFHFLNFALGGTVHRDTYTQYMGAQLTLKCHLFKGGLVTNR